MTTDELLKTKIRSEGVKIAGMGLGWFVVAMVLQAAGAYVWAARIVVKITPYLAYPLAFLELVIMLGGPLGMVVGIYQALLVKRTRLAKDTFGPLLTNNEREDHVNVVTAPTLPASKHEAFDKCPFCLGAIITCKGDENHCEACGAVWKVMAPTIYQPAIVACVVAAAVIIILLIFRVMSFFERERPSLPSIVGVIGAAALAFAFSWAAYRLTCKRNKALKIAVVRKPPPNATAQAAQTGV